MNNVKIKTFIPNWGTIDWLWVFMSITCFAFMHWIQYTAYMDREGFNAGIVAASSTIWLVCMYWTTLQRLLDMRKLISYSVTNENV